MIGLKFFSVLLVTFCGSQGKRLYFESCDSNGFTCTDNEQITYECQHNNEDAALSEENFDIFYIYNNDSNTNIKSLTISNCDRIHLDFSKAYDSKQTVLQLNLVKIGEIITSGNEWPPITNIQDSGLAEYPTMSNFERLTLQNVVVKSFRNQQYFYPPNGATVKNLVITNSHLPSVPSFGITVSGGEFIFKDNKVLNLNSNCFNVTAFRVEISRNFIKYSDLSAFSNMKAEPRWEESSLTVTDNTIEHLPPNMYGGIDFQLNQFDRITAEKNYVNGTYSNVQWFESPRLGYVSRGDCEKSEKKSTMIIFTRKNSKNIE